MKESVERMDGKQLTQAEVRRMTRDSFDSARRTYRALGKGLFDVSIIDLNDKGERELTDCERLSLEFERAKANVSRRGKRCIHLAEYQIEQLKTALSMKSGVEYSCYEIAPNGDLSEMKAFVSTKESEQVRDLKDAVLAFCRAAGKVAVAVGSATKNDWTEAILLFEKHYMGNVAAFSVPDSVPRRIAEIVESSGRKLCVEMSLAPVREKKRDSQKGASPISIHANNSNVIVGNHNSTGGGGAASWRQSLRQYWCYLLGCLIALATTLFTCCGRSSKDVAAIATPDKCGAVETFTSMEAFLSEVAKAKPPVFIGCSFNIGTMPSKLDIRQLGKLDIKSDLGGRPVETQLEQDVVVGTNGWPLLKNPKGLTIVVERMKKRLFEKDAKGAVVLAKAADGIIASHWESYTNKSLSVAGDFAANVAQTYVTLSQDAMSRNDWLAAGSYCNIAIQMLGKKIPPDVRAMQIVCAVRTGKGKLLVLEDFAIGLYQSLFEPDELFEVMNWLAQWGYIIPYAIDFEKGQLIPSDWEKKFGFVKPLQYARRVMIFLPNGKDKNGEAFPFICQRKGFEDVEMVNLREWLQETIRLYKNDRRLQYRQIPSKKNKQ